MSAVGVSANPLLSTIKIAARTITAATLAQLLMSAMSAMAAAAAGAGAPLWQDGLEWHGVRVTMLRDPSDTYTLSWPFGQRIIAPQPLRVETASTLFNGLYAMAQDDLRQDSVTAIRDGAFDHGQAIPCVCFETGLKWPYVWTRDLAYSIDLGLWRFDAARARNGLLFKQSTVREPSAPQGDYVMQDTGSGGSWPISTDRVVWFLGAKHLLNDEAFADRLWPTLRDTLAQDREFAFDAAFGLYRGETSFMDWREQSYPAWTANNVVFIAQSFALSTNVLHYEALQLAGELADAHHEASAAAAYRGQAAALAAAINAHFWRADRGLYMSYLGGDGTPFDTYDLLGISLAITSGVASGERARQSLANYPTWPAGSPVMWPERADQPIYHNRAIWPFVSAYALRAARMVMDPARIAHEIRSVIRGAALYGSNLENYELLTQGQHVDAGPLSGPVVNSPRQLWSVAAYLDVVTEGVFGLTEEGAIEPELPASLVPTLFGARPSITLNLPQRSLTLQLPAAAHRAQAHGNLLVADRITTQGTHTIVLLKMLQRPSATLRTDAPLDAPPAPAAPHVAIDGRTLRVRIVGQALIYLNGRRQHLIDGAGLLRRPRGTQLPQRDAPRRARHRVLAKSRDLRRRSGPGDWSMAAHLDRRHRRRLPRVGRLPQRSRADQHRSDRCGQATRSIRCDGSAAQRVPLVMPHSLGTERSSYGYFTAPAHAHCRFALQDGFNMSYLSHFAHYTGGAGGIDGPLNQASIGDLLIAPVAGAEARHPRPERRDARSLRRAAHGHAPLHPIRKLRCAQGTAEMIALRFETAMLLEKLHLVRRLDAFRDDSHIETLPHMDDRVDHAGIARVHHQIADEGPIDLQGVDGKSPHVAQT